MRSSLTKRFTLAAGGAAATLALMTACTPGSSSPEPAAPAATSGGSSSSSSGSGADDGTITIGFSGPAADHGWLGAINTAAIAEAEKYPEVDLIVAEGTNDANLQISQVETFINDGVDAIVLLPTDGAALTDVATRAMEAGIPVINVDREFSSTFAARTTVLGDNYGMGVSAGTYICEQLGDNKDAVIAEIAGIDSLPLTQDRSQGFADALDDCGLEVTNRVAADFTVQGGEAAASQLLSAAPKIDAIWNHDDDQGVGVLAAIDAAGRDEFFMVGGAGSANVMRSIQADDTVLKATVIYPSTQAADGIALARLLVKGEGLGDLVESSVPRVVQLDAPVVTKENVDIYLPTAFES
ncbi:substrate-binding domain-containing protein [Herbiconiux sp. KACC 21604]|uniref:substrate-binding domain-containing protein n=1 Tax=unclassified Herbiconiux TaxID=2618217 RepID=UPI001491FD21|nr:substrate-binding domain-containing protein [Herbiconiux sp. SALV-R1]QJU54863.1 substrate-binding domain-containing protein [Herbiconiux sp. SALV-R1]WPO85984.1 substrate-binding domain-containing protein [Herbiconiux sp. KACC 21604]